VIWQPVTSRMFSEIGHDAATSTLGLRFKKGGEYHYHVFSAAKHQALMASESKGKHFRAHILDQHEFTRIS